MLRSTDHTLPTAHAQPHPLLWASLIVTSLALRIPGLRESLWFDEIYRTRVILSGESAREVLLYDVHNPLYNAFMYAWIRVFGDSEFSVRLPSLLACYALTFLLYRWVRRRFSASAAFLTAAWLLLAPVPLWYSAEAKNTIVIALFAVLTLLAHDRLMTAPRSPRAIAGAVVTSVLAIACDFQLLLVLVPCWLALLVESRRVKGLAPAAALTAAASTAIAAPWVVFKALHLPKLAREYLGLFHLKHILWFLCVWLPVGAVTGAPAPNLWPLYVALPALVILLALGLRESASTPHGRVVRAMFLLPILFYIAASFVLHAAGDRTRIYQDRNLAVILPFYPLVLALGITTLTHRNTRRVLAAILLGSALLSSVLIVTVRAEAWTITAPNPDWRAAAKVLPAEVPVISVCPLMPLRYYAPHLSLLQLPGHTDPLPPLEQFLREAGASTFSLIQNPNWNPLSSEDLARLDARYPLVSRSQFRSLTVEVRANPTR